MTQPAQPPEPAAPPPDYTALGKQAAQQEFANEHAKNGYNFDPDGLGRVIDELQGVLDDQLRVVNVRSYVEAPGDDVMSVNYAAEASKSLAKFNDEHKATVAYLRSYVQTLRDIRDAYVRQDHDALDALRGATEKD